MLPLPPACLALATLLLAVALAGPRTGDAETRIFREGIAMMMVVDRSGSMNARDFVEGDTSVDRLIAVKQVLNRFLGLDGNTEGRPDDLVGLVSFARYADSAAPLTLDHRNLGAILDQTEIVRDPQEDGTALGEGLALAVERLRRSKAQSKVAILLTDGVGERGREEGELAREGGPRAADTRAGGPGGGAAARACVAERRPWPLPQT